MNNNDLFEALSGLDPKYIDEAAFELHGAPADFEGKEKTTTVSTALPSGDSPVKPANKPKVFRMKRALFVTLPAVAAILLTFSVALSVATRLNKSESASMATSDTAAYDRAEEAADSAAPYEAEEAAGAAEDSAAAYDSEESAASSEVNGSEEAAATAPVFDSEEAEGAAPAYGSQESAAAADSVAEAADEALDAAIPEADQSATKDALNPEASLGLEKAVYKDGMLTVEINGTLPADAKKLPYSIKGTGDKTLGDGTLDEILETRDPLTLDISSLDLPKGTYTLTIGEESCSFTI